MTNRTVLHDKHIEYGGKMVDFAGWDMPVNYGSQVEEHHQVRNDAGMFDVSHMVIVDLEGDQVRDYLRALLANDVAKLQQPGKALYSCMLKEDAGVIDDLIVYFMREDWFRMVVNAATRDKDLAWLQQHATAFGVSVLERAELAMIAVQGPRARERALEVMPVDVVEASAGLERFFGADSGDWFVGRTGYTGEDGFEIMLPESEAADLWDALSEAGVKPAGLGARDTLRLEAGMSLYGNDMSEDTSPLVSGLGWTIAWEPEDRDFIGRKALEQQKAAGVAYRMAGLVLHDRGVLRAHQRVVTEAGDGEITSGTHSPSLGKSIALARIPQQAKGSCQVEIRGKLLDAEIVKPVFVRDGEPV